MKRVQGFSQPQMRFDLPLLRKAERVCRFSVGTTSDRVHESMPTLRRESTTAQNELRLADFLLADGIPAAAIESLEEILREAGSAWSVGIRHDRTGLVRRVPKGVQTTSEEVMKSAGHAGARLAEAWTAAFGIDPDPSRAYSLAIKAVEDAAKPVIAPKDAVSTLGKMIGQMKADKDWGLPFQRQDANAPTPDVLLSMMRMLWAGQVDRHGDNPGAVVEITQAAAEAAVVFAVPLVHAFSSGEVRRRSIA